MAKQLELGKTALGQHGQLGPRHLAVSPFRRVLAAALCLGRKSSESIENISASTSKTSPRFRHLTTRDPTNRLSKRTHDRSHQVLPKCRDYSRRSILGGGLGKISPWHGSLNMGNLISLETRIIFEQAFSNPRRTLADGTSGPTLFGRYFGVKVCTTFSVYYIRLYILPKKIQAAQETENEVNIDTSWSA